MFVVVLNISENDRQSLSIVWYPFSRYLMFKREKDIRNTRTSPLVTMKISTFPKLSILIVFF